MVSLRRRRLLGFCTDADENGSKSTAADILHPIAFDYDLNIRAEEENDTFEKMDNDSGSSKDQHIQSGVNVDLNFSEEIDIQPNIGVEEKRRKQHRKRRIHNGEHAMIGVYFKNKKWQAAIKVDKVQIHLGTVRSQEEAAHLYDRAAFMCGREPNFELSEEEKQELRKLKWPEFLAMTRSAIFNKKAKRGRVTRKAVPPFQNSDEDGEQRAAEGSSASDDANLDTPTTI